MEYSSLSKAGLLSKLKFLLKDSAVYGIASALSRFVSIFTVPVLTRTFSKEEFGAIDAISVFGALIIPFLFIGMDSAIARYFFEEKTNDGKQQIISQPFFLSFVLSILFSLLLVLFAEDVILLYLKTDAYVLEFQIMAATLPFSFLTSFSMNLLKWTFERKRFLIVSIGNTLTTVLLVLTFIVGFNYGPVYIFHAALIAKLVFAVIGIFFIREWIVMTKRTDYLVKLLRFGFPLMVVAFLVALIPSMDRYVITQRLSLEDLGIYALGMKVVTGLLIIDRGIQTAWGPFAYATFQAPNAGHSFNLILKFFAIALSVVVLLLVTFEKVLIYIFGSESYREAHIVVVFLGFALVARSLTAVSGIGVELSKKTEYHVVSYIVGVLVGFALMYSLAPGFGIVGVAFGFMVSRIIVFVIEGALSNYSYKGAIINYFVPALIMALAFLLGLVIDSFYDTSLWVQLMIGSGITGAFVLIVWFVFLSKQQQHLLIQKIKHKNISFNK